MVIWFSAPSVVLYVVSPMVISPDVVEGDMVCVKLSYAQNGLDRWEGVKGLEVCGEDGVFYPVSEALYDWDHVLKIRCEKVKRPVEVRYCYRDFNPGNLHNTVGLPVAPFRFRFE